MMTERRDDDFSFLVPTWKKKAEFFMKDNTEVFIKLVTGEWKAGMILDIGEECLIVDERLEGKTPIFYIEIKDISARRKDS